MFRARARSTFRSPSVGLIGTWALSPSGNRAAVPSLLGGNLSIFDVDLQSPSFGQLISSTPIPASAASSLWANVDVAFSPDEDTIYIIRQGTGAIPGELARWSVPLNGWIDHNANTPGVENLGTSSLPPVPFGSAPAGLGVATDDTFLAISGWGGSGWAGRLSLDPSNPFTWTWTPVTGTSLTNAWRCAINPDNDRVAIGTYSPLVLKLFDAATMTLQGSVPLPSGSSCNAVVWR